MFKEEIINILCGYNSMASMESDRVQLLQGQDDHHTLTTQPRATSRPLPPASEFSTLSLTIKALARETRLVKNWFCCYSLIEDPTLSASALVIGNPKSRNQSATANQSSSSGLLHVESLIEHLKQLKVSSLRYDPNFKGSHDNLNDMITEFLSNRSISLFILYYSGPTNDKGDWEITTTTRYDEARHSYVYLDIIAEKWEEKRCGQSQLLIIVDALNSQKWVEKVRERERSSNIIIMASGSLRQGQYTRSLIGAQGQEYYPNSAREKIEGYFGNDPYSTVNSRCCGGYVSI